MKINIFHDKIGWDWLYIKKDSLVLCICDYEDMLSVPEFGLPHGYNYYCGACNGLISNKLNSDYNRINGYSGYDEYEDC